MYVYSNQLARSTITREVTERHASRMHFIMICKIYLLN